MRPSAVTVHIAGKVMLSGEYAVLFGAPALASTVNRFLSVRLEDRQDSTSMSVSSNLWPKPLTIAQTANSAEPLFEAARASQQRFHLPATGLHYSVDSDLDVKHGIGSSSALRLGVAFASWTWRQMTDAAEGRGSVENNMPRALPKSAAEWEVVRFAYQLQRHSQTLASGYDFATQFVGGIVEFIGDANSSLQWPQAAHSLDASRPMAIEQLNADVTLVTGGKGAGTSGHIRDMLVYLSEGDRKRRLLELSRETHDCWRAVIDHPRTEQKLQDLCHAVGRHRRFFEASAHFPHAIGQALAKIPALDEAWSYKTTGAGGEDALILVGAPDFRAKALETLRPLGWSKAEFEFSAASLEVKTSTNRNDTTHE